MANKAGKSVDTSYLTVEHTSTRGYFHRDYIAHCIRWSHIIKMLRTLRISTQNRQSFAILDVGCGKTTPLAKILAARQNISASTVKLYCGVDYGPLDTRWLSPESTFNAYWYPETDFASVTWDPTETMFQIVVCFEVCEHVEPEHALRLLQTIHRYLDPQGWAFISTPVYNPHVGAADNHVNEMSYYAFEALLCLAGFTVEAVTGTFASQRDYKRVLSPELTLVYERLAKYYESEALSIIMGPLVEPEYARNCLWRVQRSDLPWQPTAQEWEDLSAVAHSSSALWTETIFKLQAQSTPPPKRMGTIIKQLRGG